ncbi:hypothetical protein MMC27_004580 [Xylographa pallens]|nr:hypothetical protein [Xylographa pallens]
MTPSTLNPPVLDNYQAVVAEFCEFLTVAVHTILYERDIYPRTSFISARKYNFPVRQNRHPKVCKWIQDAVAAVGAELLKVYHTFFVTSTNSASLALTPSLKSSFKSISINTRYGSTNYLIVLVQPVFSRLANN